MTDEGRNFRVTLRNGVLVYIAKPADASTAGATLALTKPRLLALVGGDSASPGVELSGDASVLASLTAVLTASDPGFDIIVP